MVLVDPLLDKIQKAIDAVAEEHAYTYILSTAAQYGGSSVILFAKNKNENISDLVLKKMGVTPPVPATTTPAGTGTNTVTPQK
jgi:outer membrane protein